MCSETALRLCSFVTPYLFKIYVSSLYKIVFATELHIPVHISSKLTHIAFSGFTLKHRVRAKSNIPL